MWDKEAVLVVAVVIVVVIVVAQGDILYSMFWAYLYAAADRSACAGTIGGM